MKALIVDNTSITAFSLKRTLEKLDFSHIEVTGTADLRNYLEDNYSIIFVGTNSRDMEGLKSIQYLRTNARFARIPVVVLGESIRQDELLRMIDAGADAFLVRPVRFDVLKEKITSLIEQKQAQVKG